MEREICMDIAARRRAMGVALEASAAGFWNAAETMCRTLPPDDPDDALLLGLALAGKGEIAASARRLVAVARQHPDLATLATISRAAPLGGGLARRGLALALA